MSENIQSENLPALATPDAIIVHSSDETRLDVTDQADTQSIEPFGSAEAASDGVISILVASEGVEGSVKIDFHVLKVNIFASSMILENLNLLSGVFRGWH